MGVSVTAAGSAEAEVLRTAMVEKLTGLGWGGIRSASVEAAMRTVPRHLFVPDATLERAYAQDSVVTHRDERRVAISSASGPGVVAAQLEQLDVQPGHRVLEIGAGTGYNAACLAELAGSEGQVTAVDIGAEIVAEAREHLAAAGYPDVRVVQGDGHLGYPEGAPYDRIIVTAGAWDVPTAWREQLAPGGRLVVPLRVKGISRSVALELDGEVWRSVSIEERGFMPMRGPEAIGEFNAELPPKRGMWIRADDGLPVDLQALGAAVDTTPAQAWSGVVVPWVPFDHLDYWLAGASAQVCRILVSSHAVEEGLIKPLYSWGSMGLYTHDSFAYLIRRPAADTETSGGAETVELGACAYGPRATQLADELVSRLQEWEQAKPHRAALRIEVHPAAAAPSDLAAMITAEKRESTVFVISDQT
ncbi:methyltransferase, FxLD system [Actinocorallia sp. API 0066]|uniref:methyltransferase, FxLD system n=1 Tax=Actinocorallia sp. API 0066 TaxID=2896846 RepID=UPI001E4742F3|nr:methyltransferase, FxLD system [Actinocorallia sp. API 0066]MCD0448328.1 methyltransferase, FxLD system [Actinocorallia sp. API 0066]